MRRGALLLALAACACGGEPDEFHVQLSWRTEGSMACPADTCAELELRCDARVSVRVVDAETDQVYVDQCLRLPAARDLCGLRELPLTGDRDVPHRPVHVQVAIWPESQVGDHCPDTIEYDLRGLPQSRGQHPAIGGAQLVRAGEHDAIELALACPNARALTDDVCLADQPIAVTGIVSDFVQRTSVSNTIAEYLIVSAGPPFERPIEGSKATQWELRPGDLEQLDPDPSSRIAPTWTGALSRELGKTVCLEVLHRTEGGPTATCRPMPTSPRELDLRGAYVAPPLRKAVLAALGVDSTPAEGLVLGRVVNENGVPVAGVKVAPDNSAHVIYVTSENDRIGLDEKIAETGASGMWVSVDAGPHTMWSVASTLPSPVTAQALGGRIAGRLTVVELVLGTPTTQE